jgi:hypothetical protein
MNEKPSYAQLLAQRQRLVRQLADCPPILRGTLRRHLNKCGNPQCRCHDPKHPQRHGPYDYLSHRHGAKTQTIFLNEAKRAHAAAWVDNYHRLIETIYQLSEINFQLLRHHYDKLGAL